MDALPFPAPAELAAPSGVERTLVEERRGWLVAMNGGEFSGGLFWVPRGTAQPVPLDRVLAEPVRWIRARALASWAWRGCVTAMGLS